MTPAARLSPAVSALRYHGDRCPVCAPAARAGMGLGALCQWGLVLAICALRGRAKRTPAPITSSAATPARSFQ